MKRVFIISYLFLLTLLGFLTGCSDHETNFAHSSNKTWNAYLGGPHRAHYSSLSQINTSNVSQLKVAWIYDTKGIKGEIETNPIIIHDTLFGLTAGGQPFAINAATGKEYWNKANPDSSTPVRLRGLTYWGEGNNHRILYTHGPWLYALNPRTGTIISSFGDHGRVSLKTGLPQSDSVKYVASTSPGTVYKDLIIMPLIVGEGVGAAKAAIQAFNIKTGELTWVFHTIPEPGEYGYNTWTNNPYKNPNIGSVNSWSGMAIDRKRGIVYVPTGSAAFDFYGGNRRGKNLFANTLLALNAKTGKRIWSFQFVHHDLLDRDLPAPPTLLTVTHDGKKVDAVAQITKYGYVYLFNRVTGKPLFPIKETPVPPSPLPEEHAWPTQPLPIKPKPFARTTLTENDINHYAKNYKKLLRIFRESRYDGPFTPLGMKPTIIFPGFDGGGEWGGAATDPDGILYVNSNQVAWRSRLIHTKVIKERMEQKHLSLGHMLFNEHCSVCHGRNLEGSPNAGYPSLVDIKKRHSKKYVLHMINNGGGRMPSFRKGLSDKEKKAIVAFLFGGKQQLTSKTDKSKSKKNNARNSKNPYRFSGYKKFLTENGYPAISPPWGTLSAINMNTGEYVWTDTLGTRPKSQASKGVPKTGSQNYGGPVVTAGNLLFIAATPDQMIKAYDKKNGKLLWKAKLPAAGFATPATYQVNGKQYVVIACGGTKLGAPGGKVYVAFALPDHVIGNQ